MPKTITRRPGGPRPIGKIAVVVAAGVLALLLFASSLVTPLAANASLSTGSISFVFNMRSDVLVTAVSGTGVESGAAVADPSRPGIFTIAGLSPGDYIVKAGSYPGAVEEHRYFTTYSPAASGLFTFDSRAAIPISVGAGADVVLSIAEPPRPTPYLPDRPLAFGAVSVHLTNEDGIEVVGADVVRLIANTSPPFPAGLNEVSPGYYQGVVPMGYNRVVVEPGIGTGLVNTGEDVTVIFVGTLAPAQITFVEIEVPANLDQEPPQIVASPIDVPNSAGWFNTTPVRYAITCTDPSGILRSPRWRRGR